MARRWPLLGQRIEPRNLSSCQNEREHPNSWGFYCVKEYGRVATKPVELNQILIFCCAKGASVSRHLDYGGRHDGAAQDDASPRSSRPAREVSDPRSGLRSPPLFAEFGPFQDLGVRAAKPSGWAQNTQVSVDDLPLAGSARDRVRAGGSPGASGIALKPSKKSLVALPRDLFS